MLSVFKGLGCVIKYSQVHGINHQNVLPLPSRSTCGAFSFDCVQLCFHTLCVSQCSVFRACAAKMIFPKTSNVTIQLLELNISALKSLETGLILYIYISYLPVRGQGTHLSNSGAH